MSSLTAKDRRVLEDFLGMSSGYVLDFGDKTFGDFFEEQTGVDIHSITYQAEGTSKAKKLRCFWKSETDALVGKVILALVDYWEPSESPEEAAKALACREIGHRLIAGETPSLVGLKKTTEAWGMPHLNEHIRRAEGAINSDPAQAIGTAKELIETTCKTILAERGVVISKKAEMTELTKETLKSLKLVPDAINDEVAGSKTIKVMLNNLGNIGNGLAELRNLYGTGHGKHGQTKGLSARHARLAVGASATLATFLFETHQATKS